MTEEQQAKASAQAREFPETMEIMARLRAGLAEQLFKTAVLATEEREAIYIRVVTLDAMDAEMRKILSSIADDDVIKKTIEALATTAGE